MKYTFFVTCLFIAFNAFSQKKPLDHTVYDNWQSIGERAISNNGKLVAYTINPQEGDGVLVLQQADGKKLLEVPRGYTIKFTEDSRYLIFKIKPTFKQTRDARIRKRRPDEMPKDSLGIIEAASVKLEKVARVKNYKLPEKNSRWLAYNMEKPLADVQRQRRELDSLSRIKSIANIIDSLTRVADSLRNKLAQVQTLGLAALQPNNPSPEVRPDSIADEGTDLVVRDLNTGKEHTYKLVNNYVFNKYGNTLVVRTTRQSRNPLAKTFVLKENLSNNKVDTLLRNFNDARSFELDEKGQQLAFVVERDSAKRESQKFYKLYYYKNGDTAVQLADRFTKGIPAKWGVSEFANIAFSKSGNRLFFGTAPILPPKDTSLPEFERVSVDIWNYKDEDLMPAQLKFGDSLARRNYLARYDLDKKEVVQLGSERFNRIALTLEGDGDVFYAGTDSGKRVERQWQGFSLNDVYTIDPLTGENKLIAKNWKGRTFPSYTGKYLVLYNDPGKKYFIYNYESGQLTPFAAGIKFPLYDEENDVPDDPDAYGIVKWMEGDKYVLLYDKYDVWKVDPEGKEKPKAITNGRPNKITYRYINVIGADEKFIKPDQQLVFRTFNEKTKASGISILQNINSNALVSYSDVANIASINKADENNTLLFSKESFTNSPNLFVTAYGNGFIPVKLTNTNPQQSDYLWGTAELYKWKAYTGKQTEGILYKPENFDPKKKYSMIVYFYERNNQTLYNYQAPSPTPSRLNIPFFVSRGYVVFVPDIWYTTGHPGKNAYDYIVSGTRALIKEGFIDSTKLGLQGQSWGGYQTAYLITQTNLYAAAWAGAPVVNMFSAYGGVRWESGLNRQMQYERSQSRIGATIWEKPNLYIENSPLFHLQKVKTPLVIMSNDADGAVPWYQGIEFFTAMRRLNKPVWLLNYNGEAHNLVERKNRKDIQIREQQFFDWLLKGEPAPKWITEGVPAVMKGRDLGLGWK
ncbi:MAG TPA: prolyl oligopeptidase family serine peptidase [Chitinophagaceae bacterium]|nr:prolyl oligopeptidase family serine peptidase [Chitinophagaceae bacterium]